MMGVSARGGHGHDLADQRPDQAGLLGQAHADHGHQENADGPKIDEVGYYGNEDEANALR